MKRFALAALVPAAVMALAFALYLTRRNPIEEGFAPALAGRGRVVLLGAPFGLRPERELAGTRFVAPSAGLQEALAGTDPDAFEAAVRSLDADGILVAGRAAADTVASDASYMTRLMAFGAVPDLRGVRVGTGVALYEARPVLRTGDGQTLARLARHLLAGGAPPADDELPEELRSAQPVEVLVVVREGHRPRLWRSARGNGLGRALITAAQAARERWIERSGALGGSLEDALASHDVSVALLEEDGTLVSSSPGFLERALGPGHGVGFERPGHWRHALPRATHAAESVAAALDALLAEDGRAPTSLADPQLRIYRLRERPLGTSRAEELLDGSADADVID